MLSTPFLTYLRAAVTLLLALFISTGESSGSLGPNILPNSSLEGGTAAWTTAAPFSIVNDAANAHSGTWTGKATLSSTRSWQRIYSSSHSVWSDTSYTASIWMKGTGKVQLNVVNTGNYTTLGSKTITATSTWSNFTVAWNSGTATAVRFELYDSITGNTGGTIYFDDCQLGLTNGNDIQFLPANPNASGFNLVFSDEFNSINTIDVNHTGADGYKWYVGQYYGFSSATSSMYSVSGGVLTFTGCPVSWGSTLQTTEPDSVNGKGYHGTAFSAGSGIYFESRIAIANPSVIGTSGHMLCPAFWVNDIKGCTKLNRQMPGNPAYHECIEDDFMEYNPKWGTGCGYSSTMHDWHGELSGTSTGNLTNSNATLPVTTGTDFTQWHTYGVVWVPGTAANGWIGYRQAFFDGVAQAAVCWKAGQVGTYPPSGSYLFSLLQQDKFDLILGSCQGGTPTMLIDYVRIYAVDAAGSLTVTHNGLAPVITSPTSSAGTAGAAFSYTITATNSPTSYGAAGIPSELSLNTTTGVISGTPSTSGTFNIYLSASNAKGSGSQTLALVVNSPSASTVLPEADAFVRAGTYSNTNYGTAPVLTVKNESGADYQRESYLRFNLTAYSAPVVNAKLQLTVAAINTTPVQNTLYFVGTDTWTETGITWNNKPSGSTALGSWTPWANGVVNIDVTSQVNAEIAGDKKLSLKIASPVTGSTTNVDYASKENSNASAWGTLLITP